MSQRLSNLNAMKKTESSISETSWWAGILKVVNPVLALSLLLLGAKSFATNCAQISDQSHWRGPSGLSFDAVRANARHYWQWAVANSHCLSPDMQSKGVVAGDAHVLNFNIVRGDRAFSYSLNDFDDTGVGSYFFDFLRYQIASFSIDPGFNFSKITSLYLMGLSKGDHLINGTQLIPPKIPAEIASLVADYNRSFPELQKKYLSTRIKKSKLNHKKLGLLSIKKAPKKIQEIEKSIKYWVSKNQPQWLWMSSGYKYKLTGGSQGLIRIIALIKVGHSRTQEYEIYEFKELPQPAPEFHNADHALRLKIGKIHHNHPGEDQLGTDQIIVTRNSAGDTQTFQIRTKFPDLFEDSAPAENWTREMYEIFIQRIFLGAYLLGWSHGNQPALVGNYKKRALDDPNAFHDLILLMRDDYLNSIP
jgi:Uncharacterized protein conserved in bacteria (DUF2252)